MIKKILAVTSFALLASTATLGHSVEAEYLNSGKILPSTLPFSEAVRVGDTVYLSGQIGNIPGTLDLVSGGMKGEATQVMDNIKTSLEAHGLSMNHVVKCLVMLSDMSEWADFNDVYKNYFEQGRYPARSAMGVSALAFGAKVEAECIAVVGNDG